MASSYGGGGRGPPMSAQGDAAAYAAQFAPQSQYSQQPTAMQALASAVALPGVFTPQELQRTLRRHNGDVMRAALQLREKHGQRAQLRFAELNVGLPTLQGELRKGYAHILERAADAEGCPVLLLQLQYFKPAFESSGKLQRQGRGAADGSGVSSLEDARRLCVYLLDLAVETMEERNAPGIVVLVDLAHCSLANLEAKMVTDLLQLCKRWYPETLRSLVVLNASAVTRALSLLLSKLAGARTQARIRVLQKTGELHMLLPRGAIPQIYGGEHALMRPDEWIRQQAEIEQVDLTATLTQAHESDEEEEPYAYVNDPEPDENAALNGMQYAAVSAAEAAEMPGSVLRGPLARKKTDGVWAKHFALLRPEALLLYESATGKLPLVLIPVNDEVRVSTAIFPDRPRGAGFRIDVPGVVGGHQLAATSEQERGNWLQELQWAIDASRERRERREQREEQHAQKRRDFDALNMISFDDELPVALPKATTAGSGAAEQQMQQVRPPQPVAGMSMPPGAPQQHMQQMQQPGMQSMVQQPGMQPMVQQPGMQSMMSMGMPSSMGMVPQPNVYGAGYGFQQFQQPMQMQQMQQMPMQQRGMSGMAMPNNGTPQFPTNPQQFPSNFQR